MDSVSLEAQLLGVAWRCEQWKLGIPEHLMLSLEAADRHARPAPNCRSYTISCRCISRSLAVLIQLRLFLLDCARGVAIVWLRRGIASRVLGWWFQSGGPMYG